MRNRLPGKTSDIDYDSLMKSLPYLEPCRGLFVGILIIYLSSHPARVRGMKHVSSQV